MSQSRFPYVLTAISLWMLLVFVPGVDVSAQPNRPNVLIIAADDHAPYVMGAYGNEKARTPNLDRLASQGVRFDRAYCNTPVCTASRQSLLTGRYPRTIGVTQLRTPLPEEETTLAELLNAEGYRTAAIGKMHFNSNLRHGFDVRLDRGHHRRWLDARGAAPAPEGIEVLPQWKPFRDHARVWLNAFYRPFGAVDADMAGTYFARKASEFLQNRSEKPFFLMVSFYEPHSPFHFPVEYAGKYDPESFDVPPVHDADRWQIPAIFEDLTKEEKQGIIASYYTSVEYLDSNVGRVLGALEASGHADNTLVIYLGDHGYFLGQHGRFEKHAMFEPAVRAPLVVRYPDTVPENTATGALVEFVDLVPTILDFCDVPTPDDVQGRSFRPLLTGPRDEHREHVVVEYSENEEAMIRTDRWKLIYITGNRERQDGYLTSKPIPKRNVLLYDLKNDPDELRNLAHDPDHRDRVDELLAKLADHMVKTSRMPELIPESDDPYVILDHCLQPRDVTAATN